LVTPTMMPEKAVGPGAPLGLGILGRHQPRIVPQRFEPAAQVMNADTGFHADEAGRQVGELGFELCARQLQARRMMAPRLLRPTRWKVVLPMSMPRTATVSLEWRGMAGSLLLVTPRRGGTAGSTAGPFHYETRPRLAGGAGPGGEQELRRSAEHAGPHGHPERRRARRTARS